MNRRIHSIIYLNWDSDFLSPDLMGQSPKNVSEASIGSRIEKRKCMKD